jgi:NDP-sugar pyrophosphorylase family protein
MQLLIPAAGLGSRFTSQGYLTPKPLLPVNGRPMIRQVVEDCVRAFGVFSKIVVVCRAEMYDDFVGALGDLSLVEIKTIKDVTAGAAETAFLAADSLVPDESLVIANSDQHFTVKKKIALRNAGAGCLTFDNDGHNKWSFVKADWLARGDRTVLSQFLVVEKPTEVDPLDRPTCGVYWWARAADYMASASRAMQLNERTGPNMEFYIAPLLNKAKQLHVVRVDAFVGLGTPEDYTSYLTQNR